MTDERVFNPDRKKIKAAAKVQLAKKGVLFKLALAIMICWVTYMTVELLEAAIYYGLEWLVSGITGSVAFNYILTYSMDAVSFLAIAPMAMGTYRLASLLSAGDSAKLSEMFYYWNFGRYFRALAAFAVVALPVWIYRAIFNESIGALNIIYQTVPDESTANILFGLAAIGVFFVFAGIACLLLLPYGRLFSVAAAVVNGEGQPIGKCIRAALLATQGRTVKIFVFRFSFFPILLLSLATVGIMLILFTTPYMLISYFYYNAHLFGVDPADVAQTEVTFDER